MPDTPSPDRSVEPWLRGTHGELDPIHRQIIHALELADEDAERWCSGLTTQEMHARPFALVPVAFHLRHIARSLDRLLTYAEGLPLNEARMAALHSELDASGDAEGLVKEFRTGLAGAKRRILFLAPETFAEGRVVGRAKLPSTVGGLLVHCAEHTQRHAGQMVTTAKLILQMRRDAPFA